MSYSAPATLAPPTRRSLPIPFETAPRGSTTERRWSPLKGSGAYWIATSLVIDLFALAVACVTAVLTEPLAGVPAEALVWQLAFPLLTMVLFLLRGAYAPRLRLHAIDDLRGVLAATGVAAMAVISLRVTFTDDVHAAAQTARLWVLATVCLSVARVGLLRLHAHARRNGRSSRSTLVVGAGRTGHLAAKRLLAEPELGLHPVGFLDKEPMSLNGQSSGLPVLGASWDLDRVVADHGIEHVVIAFSTAPHHVLLRVVRRCWELGVPVSVLPRLFEVEGQRVTVEHIGALPLVGVHAANPRGWQFKVKYAIDKIVAAIALLLLLPLLATIALAVWLTMGRPIFFRQPRVGANGHQFEMVKFRTMKGRPERDGEADVGWAQAQLEETDSNGHGGSRASNEGDRRTRLGRVLRTFSLDELPQIWNVLCGDMSLVGPRPERVSYVRRFERAVYRYDERHRAKSGITGWAQVHGLRGKTSLSDRVEWDNYYIENWSPWLDFKIILMTVTCVLRGQREER